MSSQIPSSAGTRIESAPTARGAGSPSILHAIETDGPGGAEQMMLQLAVQYREWGYDSLVCLQKEGWLADRVRELDMPLLLRPLGRSPDLPWVARMRHTLRERSVQAVHAHEFAMNFHAGLAARSMGIPVVATFHGRGYYTETRGRRLACRLTSRLARVVGVSDDIRRHLCETAGLTRSRVQVIPNGIDTERFRFSPEARERERAALGIDPGHLLIGTIGSYYPVKGHAVLVEAMRNVVDECPEAHLILVGQGPLSGDLEHQIVEMGLQENASVVGYREDPAGLLSALDVFAMPSLSEGMPLALLEAAANGRPIVASAVGGIPEFIHPEGTGLLVAPANPSELAGALLRLIRSADLRKRLGETAAASVAQEWSIRSTAEAYMRLLGVRTRE